MTLNPVGFDRIWPIQDRFGCTLFANLDLFLLGSYMDDYNLASYVSFSHLLAYLILSIPFLCSHPLTFSNFSLDFDHNFFILCQFSPISNPP